jgi:OPA family glycerol-3-phosphate transporter-like MFS transporter
MTGAATPLAHDEAPRHARAFRVRRFANWFPLGLTYACFYMGRYNFNVAKGTIGATYHYDKAQMGIVATAGFWTYALSVLFNGPLADRFGGRRAILFGAIGAAVLNAAIGFLFFTGTTSGLIASMAVLYAINSYFQSFGALSVVKVNSAWFHVRERGVLGGFFGAMISCGYALALIVGGKILDAFKPAIWPVFVVPSGVLLAIFAFDFFVIRNRPSDAGHADFPTGDEAHDDDATASLGFFALVKRVLEHRVIRVLIVAEFCTGLVRQGVVLYFTEFLNEKHGVKPGSDLFNVASWGITVGGIAGAFVCGYVSDYVFQSRRAPVAFLFYVGQVVALVVLGLASTPRFAAVMIGVSCMWIFGVHGMLSGTASMDFGGKRAAATAAGLLDGVQYLGSGLVGFGLGKMLDSYGWAIWPYALVPFSVVGAALMTTLWNARPARAGAH